MKYYKRSIGLFLALSLIISLCVIQVSATDIQVSTGRKENLPNSDKWYLSACKSSYILNAGEEYQLVFSGCTPEEIFFVPVFGTKEDFILDGNTLTILKDDVQVIAFVPSNNDAGADIILFYTLSKRQLLWQEMQPAVEECLGTPYVFGGKTPGVGIDCSAFVSYVYRSVGLLEIGGSCNHLWQLCQTVDTPQIGDLIFFQGTYDTEGMSHVAIYAGDGMMYHAGNNGVELTQYEGIPYWQSHFAGYGTMIGE